MEAGFHTATLYVHFISFHHAAGHVENGPRLDQCGNRPSQIGWIEILVTSSEKQPSPRINFFDLRRAYLEARDRGGR
jgi:hypothetical protein